MSESQLPVPDPQGSHPPQHQPQYPYQAQVPEAYQGQTPQPYQYPSPQPPTPPPVFYKNPSIAAVLSFLFMGLGQIYNGQIGKGIVFIVLYGISWLLCFVLIGFITTPILWILGMIYAYYSAHSVNREMYAQQMRQQQ